MPYFNSVKSYCSFLSTARSGHSIVAHLLTAHPKILISDELNAIKYFKEGYSAKQVFALIKYQDYRYQKRSRKKSGYSYQVNGLWQNIYDKNPEVIGDAKGFKTVELLCGKIDYLDTLRADIGIPLRFIIHLRNPFDAITTQSIKRNVPLEESIENFINFERKLSKIHTYLSSEEYLVQRHEDLIHEPDRHFIQMFNFLEVDIMEKVIDACASKIWKNPNITREKLKWSKDNVKKVRECLKDSPLYKSYLDI
jgi:hypothetical protein